MEREGIILSCVGGRYTVLSDTRRYSCYARGAFRHAGIKPVCGDRVRFVPGVSFPDDGTPLPPSAGNDGYLSAICERTTVLARPPIANVDTLLIFAAVGDPAPDTVYLDRLTVCSLDAGIRPVLLFNKTDLDPEKAENLAAIYRSAGFDTVCLSAKADDPCAFDVLRDLVRGKITAMAGNSGVGKTTFFNRIFPGEQGQTGLLSQKIARGKNTTRVCELHSLSRSIWKTDGLFADTAGFSRLELSSVPEMNDMRLTECFPDFAPYLGTCRFTKCTHKTEVGCAIREAVEAGAIPPTRYQSYLALKQELQNK